MTKQTEALKMAIELMERFLEYDGISSSDYIDVLDACKEALAQPAQEPVAWKHFDKAYSKACNSSQPQDWMDAALLAQQARNTHPAPSWQGLSEDEIDDVKTKAIMGANGMSVEQLLGLIVSLTEQALKEKNT